MRCFLLLQSSRSRVPMIQQLEGTLRANAVPQVPQFQPSAVAPSPTPPITSTAGKPIGSIQGQPSAGAKSLEKPVSKNDESKSTTSVNRAAGDPLGNARNKVQEEIGREFAALMASGTLVASEAAALATRKVMQRYGLANSAQS